MFVKAPVSVPRTARNLVVSRAATALPSNVKSVAPLGDRVFVKIAEVEEVSTGGILLPTAAQKKPTAGDIVNAGTAKQLKAGDRVVYSKYAGTEVELGGDEYVLLKEEDCIGVLSAGASITDLKPLSDRVLVEVAEPPSKTSGGIILTTSSADKPTVGKVVAVGPGRTEGEKTTPVGVAVGATILYQKYSGTEFEEGERQFIVIREAEVMGVLA